MHGGVFSTLVESVCSRATALAVLGDGMAAMGQSINVSFLRPILEGTAEVGRGPATAAAPPGSGRPRSSTPRSALCALAQMTIAVARSGAIRRSGS